VKLTSGSSRSGIARLQPLAQVVVGVDRVGGRKPMAMMPTTARMPTEVSARATWSG